jgi:hypothetical protein
VRQSARWYSVGLLACTPGCRDLLSVLHVPLWWRPHEKSLLLSLAAALVQANVDVHGQENSEGALLRDGMLRAFFAALWSECSPRALNAAAGANWPS